MSATAEHTPHQILVVDDEPDLELLVRQRFRRQIREGEFEFFFSHNGEEALQALDGQPTIDLVLSDINMPVMDGLTLLGKLRERHGVPEGGGGLGVRRHAEHPHRDESRGDRLPDEADRFRRPGDHDPQDAGPRGADPAIVADAGESAGDPAGVERGGANSAIDSAAHCSRRFPRARISSCTPP